MQERQVTKKTNTNIFESNGIRYIEETIDRTESVVNPDAQTASEATEEDHSVENKTWIVTENGERLEDLEDVFNYMVNS